MRTLRTRFSFLLISIAFFQFSVSSICADGVFDRTASIQVWGNSVEKPVVIKRVLPKYPKTRADISGLAIVEVWVRADGSVAHTKAIKTLPLGMSEAAAEAVRNWRFTPGKVNGTPVPVFLTVSVNFEP